MDHLFEAILCLKNKEECYTFFEDVCTINELLSLSQRFEVAKMLTDNVHTWIFRKRQSFHSHDQQSQPFPQLWKRRL